MYQVKISKEILKLVNEYDDLWGKLSEYQNGKTGPWLKEIEKAEHLIAVKIRYEILSQIPPWEPTE